MDAQLPNLIDLSDSGAGRAAEHLERGDVLYFPPGMLRPPSDEDIGFLREALPKALRLKNISYHPNGDYLSGIKGAGSLKRRTRDILNAHNLEVRRFLGGYLPEYAEDWSLQKVNFRPLEEEGRQLSRHSSNEYVHVDAFASGATHGDRILRFFTNVHGTQDRVWRSAGTFEALMKRLGDDAGITRGVVSIAPSLGDRAYSGVLHGLMKIGVAPAHLIDSSPYDRLMRRFHNYLKDSDELQADVDNQARLRFPPGSSWAVMTDMVSHAVISGRHALVNTFHVRLADCVLPERAPINILSDRLAA